MDGWLFSDRLSPVGIILRSGARQARADLDIARPDVLFCHETARPPLNCGFSVALELPPGRHETEILAEFADGAPMRLDRRTVEIKSPILQANIETPHDMQCEAGAVKISGWCVHPTQPISTLQLKIDDALIPCSYGTHRPDVLDHLGKLPGSAACGFWADTTLDPGNHHIQFVATLADGSKSCLDWPCDIRVSGQSRRKRLGRGARNVFGLARFITRQGSAWILENRRFPPVGEWHTMVKFAGARYRGQNGEAENGNTLEGFNLPAKQDRYQVWQRVNRLNSRSYAFLQMRLQQEDCLPKLSLVMPVYNPSLEHLKAAVDSVRRQIYGDWELCIADDSSSLPEIAAYLKEISATDTRIKVIFRTENGNISRCSNSAAKLSGSDFLVFLDQDDLLAPGALAHLALTIAENPQADLIYSDDDKTDDEEQLYAPQFKPDWSPTLLLGFMYFSHLFCIRRALFDTLGGLRQGYEGSQDYDLALRASEKARKIVHIPQILYHWRATEGSTAQSASSKPNSVAAGMAAVRDALVRRGIDATVCHPQWAQGANAGVFSIRFPHNGPKVQIIIPTCNGLSVLKRCISSLAQTRYENYQVLIVDNESTDEATLNYLAKQPHRVEKIGNPDGRFNFAYINNRAAELVDAEFLLFLNNDTEIISPEWLSQMVGYARMEGVGATGARLLFPDRRVQHAGIVHGYYNGLAGPAFKLQPEWAGGHLSLARVSRDCSAVTAACLLTPRKLFLEVGGFDEKSFEVAYNDVDYCYRLADRGLRSVYCAEAILVHHEGHSRGFVDRPAEVARFRHKYRKRRDPYYSPHLSLEDESFQISPRRLVETPVKPVRALMCAFNLNLEGAPFSQFEMTLGLRDAGFVEPQVYSPVDGPLREAYEQAGIKVHVAEHPLSGVFDEPAYDQAVDKFAEFIRATHIDVVYGNTLQTFYAIDAASRLGMPSLWNPRESEPWQTYFSFLPNGLARRALQCFAKPYRVIFVANATREAWSPLESHANFAVIHNGLKLDAISKSMARMSREAARESLGLSEQDTAIVLPGTVCERKGQMDLAQALHMFDPGREQRGQYFIVGDRDGEYSRQIHKSRAEMSPTLAHRFHIVPETADIHRYYRAADVALCTSRIESFPRVILEAMAFGLPIISTQVFGIKEQIRHGVNALLYEPGDIPKLATHLATLIEDGQMRQQLAENAGPMLATLNSYDEMVEAYGMLFAEASMASPIACSEMP